LAGVGVVDIDFSEGLRDIILSWILLPLYDGPVREELDGLEVNMPFTLTPAALPATDPRAIIILLLYILAFLSYDDLSHHPRLYDPGFWVSYLRTGSISDSCIMLLM
jgi:hypothetical protein